MSHFSNLNSAGWLTVAVLLVLLSVFPSEARDRIERQTPHMKKNCLCSAVGTSEARLSAVRGDVLVSGKRGMVDGKTVKRIRPGDEIITASRASGKLNLGGTCRFRLTSNGTFRLVAGKQNRLCVRISRASQKPVPRRRPPYLDGKFGKVIFTPLPGVLHYLHHKRHDNPVSR